jgi:glycerol uptake facilitator-like aquaporin
MVAIGSTILARDLFGAASPMVVLINAIAVAFVLFALIETFSSVSGAHFNPAVTLALLSSGETGGRKAGLYIAAQLAGGLTGLLSTHLMFYDTNPVLITVASTEYGLGAGFAEFLGTFLLVGVIIGCVRGRSRNTSLSVAFVVGGMLLTTSSTMFANPAVTLFRTFTYAPCGIDPLCALMFIIAEVAGGLAAVAVFTAVFPAKLKERCDPFECKGPLLVELPPTNGR